MITRRIALGTISALGAGTLGWLAWRAFRAPSFSQPLGPTHVDAAFGFDQRIQWRELGKRYLTLNPDDHDAGQWVVEMLEATPACCRNRDELARVIVGRIAADFTSGQIVVIHGWVLSRTEARLAALAALSSPA